MSRRDFGSSMPGTWETQPHKECFDHMGMVEKTEICGDIKRKTDTCTNIFLDVCPGMVISPATSGF